MDFFETQISSRAVELAIETLRSTFVSEGKRVKQFEQALEQDLGIAHPVAVNSGTSALHLALVIAGVTPGDEVILPPQTFVAPAMAVLAQHARPVFADIDPQTGNISPSSIREKITARTKAVIAVHWAGYPCDLDEIHAVANEQALPVIEDAAHALGATYKERPIGNISRLTCFSFQAIKHLTTGDGGAICCTEQADFEQARRQRWFGIDRQKAKPSVLGGRMFDVAESGYKYHMNDIAASIGLGNLDDFSARLAWRQAIGQLYRDGLADVPGLQLLRKDRDRTHAYWLFTLRVQEREAFVRKLKSAGIASSVVDQRIDRLSIFGQADEELPGQTKFDDEQISLPVHESFSDDDVRRIVSVIRSGW